MNLFLFLAIVINVRRILGFQSVIVTCSNGVEDYYRQLNANKRNSAPSSPTSKANGSVLVNEPTPADPIPNLSQNERGKLCESVLTSSYFKQTFMEEYADKNDLKVLKEVESRFGISDLFWLNYRKRRFSRSKRQPSDPSQFVGAPTLASSPTELSFSSGESFSTEQPPPPAESLTLSDQYFPSTGSSPTHSKQFLSPRVSSPIATRHSVSPIKSSLPETQNFMKKFNQLHIEKSPPESPSSVRSDIEPNSPHLFPIEEKLFPHPEYVPHYPYSIQFFNMATSGNAHSEFMFPCLGRQIGGGTIVQHFISFGHKDGTYLVFQKTRGGSINLVALAEVLPELVPFEDLIDLETYYAEQRNEHERNTPPSSWYQSLWRGSGSSGDRSSICALNDIEKLRTCTLIMSLPEYKEEVDFTVTPFNVDCKCGDMKISFGQTELNKKNYREHSISCRGKNKKTEGYSLYRVSASYVDEKSVFVYKVAGDKQDINFLISYIKNLTVF